MTDQQLGDLAMKAGATRYTSPRFPDQPRYTFNASALHRLVLELQNDQQPDHSEEPRAMVPAAAPQQPAPQPLTDDLLVAAKNVMDWIEIAHRPPVCDPLEGGRMVLVRLHALADLRAAIERAEATKEQP